MYTILSGGYNSRHPETFFMSRPKGLDSYLLLIVKCAAFFRIGEEEFTAAPDSALLIEPGIPYQYRSCSGDYMDDWLHFDCDVQELSQLNRIPFRKAIPLGNPSPFSLYLQQIIWENNYTSPEFKGENIHMLMSVLLNNLILADTRKESTQHYNPYYAKLQSLRLSFRSQSYKNFSGEEIAASMGISFSYFQHLYKELFHVPFKTDLLNMRIEYAKGLILNTNLKLEQIAQMSGYSNEIHFYRQFRKKTGMTPKEFLRKGASLIVDDK